MLVFNDMSSLVGHFVLSPREREKRDRRDSRGDKRERQGRKRNRNESEETEKYMYVCLFVLRFLRPSQPNGVMSSVVSLP